MPTPDPSADASPQAIADFIARWRNADGTELAKYQIFITELTALLGLPPPDPAHADDADNAYVFERRVTFRHPDGSTSNGRIDCYRRGCYVLESKQSGLPVRSTAWGAAMLKAHAQGSNYARALPPEEGRPPFLLVIDVGRHIGLYADFTRSAANYLPYPDALSHRKRKRHGFSRKDAATSFGRALPRALIRANSTSLSISSEKRTSASASRLLCARAGSPGRHGSQGCDPAPTASGHAMPRNSGGLAR